jgi:hypothetical protein
MATACKFVLLIVIINILKALLGIVEGYQEQS